MKKALAVLLSVLAVFSMFGVVAFAAEEAPENSEATIKVVYCDDEGNTIEENYYAPGTILDNSKFPANPTKQETETTRYTFKGWRCENDGKLYYQNTPYTISVNAQAGDTVRFVAEFSEENIAERQTFWNFIESIFARFNLIFQYFAKIFEW